MGKCKQDFITALNNGGGYGYIAMYYTMFSPYELADIIKECLFAMNDEQVMQVAEELAELWSED